MTIIPLPSVALPVIFVALYFLSSVADGLGSASTVAVIYGSDTVCGIVAREPTQRIECFNGGANISIGPNVSFTAISGGRNFFCGLRSGGNSLLCWNRDFVPKRVYYNDALKLKDVSVGDDHVCALVDGTGVVKCWRGERNNFPTPGAGEGFLSITSGRGFSCGILNTSRTVKCWGTRQIRQEIQAQFGNVSMASLIAGDSHVCGTTNSSGVLICRGSNNSRQLDVPSSSPFEFSSLALGLNHSCALRQPNKSVVCWGGGGEFSNNVTDGVSFELIVAGTEFTCGLVTRNFSLFCWGPGLPGNRSTSAVDLPLSNILPGPCVQDCSCGIYGDSQGLCSGSGNICKPCDGLPPPPALLLPLPPPPPAQQSQSKKTSKGLLAFAVIGSVGIFLGACTLIYSLWAGICCCQQKKVHNSVQPTITGGNANAGTPASSGPLSALSRSSTIRRQGSRAIMRQSSRAIMRQRSGTSSKHADRAEEFTLSELAAATDGFSSENKIGKGSFGIVYRGKLVDGREVAVKRGETSRKLKKLQEKETAFDSELAFLSRLHHKHLVGLVGFCEERDERLLVYEYMKNGALYDHLHSESNIEKSSSILNSWRMRIKIALDAARGIEYLHDYAVPPIIHRDIKSSNILLDGNWTARVSDFGLSLMGPETNGEYMHMKAAGTVGYIDPEYYGLNVLTPKSDVYGMGVVLLELLTGKTALFKEDEEGGPISMVDFAVPMINGGELQRVLDRRVGVPEANEAEAVELTARVAVKCVGLEGRDRPTMADIVTNLESALSLMDHYGDDSHSSASATFSIVPESD
ncbi:PREDICTED: putative serine/threonine-protein kinase-like protein CCR3 [Nelumbo nucifera]|uniref:non-specific serine/threonine protein kinase n=2 Tax=Nelumbo nucifera TaxID=4432 RepID=A0A1U8ACP0_NELNU|nr:PREDICTED: putative serine/threonine-protein kinase-like protein CCR3 [Nelumbo nucifera]DAD28026.1 TPA_asm: hypothetical protein HUJ06_029494 [Nelumbo nucifera]